MNISHRLRTCARHTGLDAVIELLNEAADEIDAMQARANGHATQPAEVTDDLVEKARGETFLKTGADLIPEVAATFARAILALRPVQVPTMGHDAGCVEEAATTIDLLREALKPFAAIDLLECRLPPEFAIHVLRARGALTHNRY